MTRRVRRTLRIVSVAALTSLAASCERREVGDRTTPPAGATDRESAAETVVAFLQGRLPFERLLLADSVALHIGKEGGGATSVVPRDSLRRRDSWAVTHETRRISFVPDSSLTRLTTKAGRHFVCQEQMLATQFPTLAAMPHVGTRLQSAAQESCLQTWNMTFVFDTTGSQPRLVAAVYDQWEW